MVSCLKYVLCMFQEQPILVMSFYSTMTMYYGSPADIATVSLGAPDQENEDSDLVTTVQLDIGAGDLECDIIVTLDTNGVTASKTHRSPHSLSTPSHVVFPFLVHSCFR